MKEKKKATAGKVAEKAEMKIGVLGEEIARQLLISNLCRVIFNKEQAADFTTLSTETIDKAVDRGDLKSYKCGSRVVFFRGDLIEWILKCPPRPRKRKAKEVTA